MDWADREIRPIRWAKTLCAAVVILVGARAVKIR